DQRVSGLHPQRDDRGQPVSDAWPDGRRSRGAHHPAGYRGRAYAGDVSMVDGSGRARRWLVAAALARLDHGKPDRQGARAGTPAGGDRHVTPRPQRQPPGLHHLSIGDIVVTALNDGMFEGSFDWLTGVEAAEATRLHQASFRAVPPRLAVNAFLLHMPDRLVLVDSGCGGNMGPDMGRLAGSLAAMGVLPGDVDSILATHLHPDHVGGLVDAEGRAMFPNAELIVHANEPRFWGDDAVLAKASDQDRQFIALARA